MHFAADIARGVAVSKPWLSKDSAWIGAWDALSCVLCTIWGGWYEGRNNGHGGRSRCSGRTWRWKPRCISRGGRGGARGIGPELTLVTLRCPDGAGADSKVAALIVMGTRAKESKTGGALRSL